MTVFICCEPAKGFDFTPALAYGELKVLLTHTQSMLAPVPTIRQLKEKLANFSDDDYIIPVGDPVLMSTVACVASYVNHGRVKFLKWDRIQKKYISIQIDITGKAQ